MSSKKNSPFWRKLSLLINFILDLNRDLFGMFLAVYIIFFLLKEIRPEAITYSFNLNILFYITIISGILMVFTKEKKKSGMNILFTYEQTIKKRDYVFVFFLAILTGVLTYFLFLYKIKAPKNISLFVSIISIILFFLLSILVLKEENVDEEKYFHG